MLRESSQSAYFQDAKRSGVKILLHGMCEDFFQVYSMLGTDLERDQELMEWARPIQSVSS